MSSSSSLFPELGFPELGLKYITVRPVAQHDAGGPSSSSSSAAEAAAAAAAPARRCCVVASVRKEPVNAMDLPLWRELAALLRAAEADERVCGLVLCSGLTRSIFTAGNDIKELHARMTTPERYREFWTVSNGFLSRLYRSPLATVAAVKGSCPAGGCIMSLCCDAVVMVDGRGTIGLNEVALGIAVPKYWASVFVRKVGHARGEPLLKNASLLRPREALAAGLVDHLVDAEEELIPTAERMVVRMALAHPDQGRAMTKQAIRGELADAWARYAEEEARTVWGFLSDAKTVGALDAVLRRLQKRPGPAAPAGAARPRL